MRQCTTALMALALSSGLMAAGPSAAAHAKPSAGAAKPSESVARVASWVIAASDNHDLPFVIIDKVAAEVFVFDAEGGLKGAGPALLGLTRGDDSTPGIGDRELSAIPPEQRTTPAGRFLAGFGPAGGHHKVLWVDYATAISLHPVVTANPKERRLARLRSPSPKDNRITFGCINVSTRFYQNVLLKTLTRKGGVIYILPDRKPLDEVFPALPTQARVSDARSSDPEGAATPDAASSAASTSALVR